MEAVLKLLVSLGLVFVAAVVFTNAIECIGCRMKLGSGFVGAIISPLFTSIPEMTVFLVAVFFYSSATGAGEDIGIGTLFGQPFMASSMSYGLVGMAVLLGLLMKKRDTGSLVINKTLMIPYIFITILFPLTIVPGLLKDIVAVKYIFGAFFLGCFFFYVWMMYRRKATEVIEDADNPYLCTLCSFIPILPGGVIQLLIGVALLYLGSESLVGSVDALSGMIGISALGLAIIVIPAATAIPETAAALIWGFRGKDTLSLGSLVGEKILYSTFYPGLGLFVTDWALDRHAYSSVGVTFVISLILLYFINKQKMPWWSLAIGLVAFVAYAIAIFAFRF